MTNLEVLRALRAHLLKHWSIAQQWAGDPYANDGYSPAVECLALLANRLTPGRNFPFAEYGFTDVAILGEPDGREELLQLFERAIAKLEEHEAAEVAVVPEPEPVCLTS